MQAVNLRQTKGEAIARQFGWVNRISELAYKVHSQSSDSEYDVVLTILGWRCSCPDSTYRGGFNGMQCKHIFAVELSFILRTVVAREPIVIKPINPQCCPKCKCESIKKKGLRHNKRGDIQKFQCRMCGHFFTINLGFERMHATPQMITSAIQLYFTGESYRNIHKFLKLQGVTISHVGVLRWVRRYVSLMQGYTEKIQPQLGSIWRTDEMYVKFSGNMKYLFAMIDDETRFRIAQQVSTFKGTSDVRPMFKEAEERAGKKPRVLISDGAPNFALANKKEWTNRYAGQSTQHIAEIRMAGVVHNNKMERQNGEVRDREKVVRGLKKEDSALIEGFPVFHNFIREHEGLGGRTPAEAAGITVEGENKWLTIIQNAKHEQRGQERT
jgi:putative transposase